MKDYSLIVWLVFVFLILRGLRYVLGARIYLTSAIQEVTVAPCADDQVPEEQRILLGTLDWTLEELGMRPIGYVVHRPFLTYYDRSEHSRVFLHASEPIEAHVSRRAAPEYGASVNIQWVTRLRDGRMLITGDMGSSVYEALPLSLSECRTASAADLFKRHQQRVQAVIGEKSAFPPTLRQIAAVMTRTYSALRLYYRDRHWSVESEDPMLDRVTLKGAIGLIDQSIKSFGTKGVLLAPLGEVTDVNRRQRIEADYQAVERIARAPRAAPGIPWPLLILMAATAVISVTAMAVWWDIKVALIIFTVILLHEGGHALAMRRVGHAAVHIFFVPLLGALTIGRAINPSIRERTVILLAGPVPGLVIGLLLLLLYEHDRNPAVYGAAIGFLGINALNIIPVVPLDGGRVFETLSRPEGVARFMLQISSVLGLVAVALYLRDPVFGAFALLSVLIMPRQWFAYKFRASVARKINDSTNWLGVVRAALGVMTESPYAKWRSPARQELARAAADQFTAPTATKEDWVFGMVTYLASLAIVGVAALVWMRVKVT